MNNIKWDDLRYFHAAAELGSLSAAARKLGSNQPTVGRHIDSLEVALGVKLFQRHKRGLTLTQEGVLVLEQSQQMFSGVQNIQRLVDDSHQKLDGSVHLTMPEGLANLVVIPQLEQFYQSYPNLQLILHVSSRAANLTRGEADIALRLYRPEENDLVVRKLGVMELGLYASTAYLERHGYPQDVAELSTHQMITYANELAELPENRWLLQHISAEQIPIKSDSTMSRLVATEQGLGISIQPTMMADKNLGLVRLLSDISLPSHTVWMVYHQDLRQIPRVSVTVEFITGLFRQLKGLE